MTRNKLWCRQNVAGWTLTITITQESGRKKLNVFFRLCVAEQKKMKCILFLNLVLQWDYIFLLLRSRKTKLDEKNLEPKKKVFFVHTECIKHTDIWLIFSLCRAEALLFNCFKGCWKKNWKKQWRVPAIKKSGMFVIRRVEKSKKVFLIVLMRWTLQMTAFLTLYWKPSLKSFEP